MSTCSLNVSVLISSKESSSKTKWHFSLIDVTGIEIPTDPEHLQLRRSDGHSVTTWHTFEFSSPIVIPGFKERTDALEVRFQLSRASKRKNITDQFSYVTLFTISSLLFTLM